MPPVERYRILREDCAEYFDGEHVRVQWVGHGSAAMEFCSLGAPMLPHGVEYVFSIPEAMPPYTIRAYR